jgi:hypothetical protein
VLAGTQAAVDADTAHACRGCNGKRGCWSACGRTARSVRAYARAVAVSVDTTLLDLRALVGRGLVRAEGTTRDRRNVLAGDDRS